MTCLFHLFPFWPVLYLTIILNHKHLDILNRVPFCLTCSSEFEELEAAPSLDVIEGPLEPPTSSAAMSAPEVPDSSFVNLFSVSTFLVIS